ncbi:MAG: ABC transporter ATP-binding protein [Betaproteobacteria bacterium]|jgi:general nucleoside transport system ATP-binding protein|nr:ABC transporter ATP-binding protein [Pseudomonadota bacterium]NBT71912.1 ABC transporter ATP-binding protein [Betaproteobacteria bacterium]NCV15647.1 ABC transporter ATP-binding protein [Betaproteobacteria bacterium]NCW81980.1 ABC transporter ATP-binding protein [Betaproteobacteria bacterium]
MPEIPRLRLQGVSKSYGSLRANDKIDLDIKPGSIHAVLGENGAGKSTLMKLIFGLLQPDEGDMFLDGIPIRWQSPEQARAYGIAMVFQHFALFESLSVAENVWLGMAKHWTLAAVSTALETLAHQYGLAVDPNALVHRLSVGERQRVEIARGLLARPRVMILDEPTSVLSPQAAKALFAMLRTLASEGCSVIYISHKLHEIRELCDDCTVLRQGRVTGRVDPRRCNDEQLSALMIGGAPPPLVRAKRDSAAALFAVDALSVPAIDEASERLNAVSFELMPGEILGIAGVSGNGQGLLLDMLAGEPSDDSRLMRRVAGHIRFQGRAIETLGVRSRRRLGIIAVPAERLGRATVPELSLADNMFLSDESDAWQLDHRKLRDAAQAVIADFSVKAPGPEALASDLSGGNLQKFIMGRALRSAPKVLLVSQPTWGVDVGASAQIRQQLLALRDAGAAILVISEELDELFQIADRFHVMYAGHLSAPILREDATLELIGQWMGGSWLLAQQAPSVAGAARRVHH